MHELYQPPVSLYIHIPWCIQKCPYCDFNSYNISSKKHSDDHYIDTLLINLAQQIHTLQQRPLHSIFIGGGTPSLMAAASIERLLIGIDQLIGIPSSCEITLEANPGSSEYQRFKTYRHIGIHRLSIGIQSFHDGHLKRLGRVHNAEQAHTAIKKAQQAGFKSMNVDIIYGLPQQSVQQAIADLDTALHYHPQHVSWYQLTLEPNTPFYRRPPPLPSTETIIHMGEAGGEYLEQAGLQRYEISAYSRPDHACQHNLNYWNFGDYLGIGAGAHSKITDLKTHTITRTVNLKSPSRYSAAQKTGLFIVQTRTLQPQDIIFEFMLNRTRLTTPISSQVFEQCTRVTIKKIEKILKKAQELNFLHWDGQCITITSKGHLFLNEWLMYFLP